MKKIPVHLETQDYDGGRQQQGQADGAVEEGHVGRGEDPPGLLSPHQDAPGKDHGLWKRWKKCLKSKSRRPP